MSARRSIIPVFIPHLGCPHTCVFCNQSKITGQAAGEAMESLLKLCESSHENAELAFYGGSFTAIPPEVQLAYLKPAKDALDKGKLAGIRLSTRPDAVDDVTLRRLRHYGVSTIELGAQSMQNEVLRLCNRGHSAEDVRRSSALIQNEGFQLVLQMMTGLPGDDDDGALDTARQLIAMKPNAVRIYPTVIVQGTQLERMWREGSYREHSVEDAVQICSRILPLFQKAGIPVIRLGLNPTADLSSGEALAGAYHPALGELVRSRVLRNRVELLLENESISGTDVIIEISDSQRSQMIGQKRCNINWLQERFKLKSVRVRSCSQAGVLRVFKST